LKKIYDVRVVAIGSSVEDFIKEKMVVIFGEQAPKELHDIAVLHTGGILEADIEAGDTLSVDGEEFKVTAVGNVANQTMRDLGHATLNFNGEEQPDLPGTICIEERPLPDFKESSTITFIRK
jgi:PTS system glucitol/sorbitol-specific IIA component